MVAQPRNAVGPNNANPDGQTELVLDEILKPNAALNGRKFIVTPREIAAKGKFLIAMEMRKGEIEAYLGRELDAGGAMLKYVRGAIQLKDKSKAARLRYNVDFLTDPNQEVAVSANVEIQDAAYADLRKLGEALNPAELTKMLAAEDVPPRYRGNLILLLGHCGKKEHAQLIRKRIDGAKEPGHFNELSSLYFAYVLLEPKEGWDFVCANATNADAAFLKRYAAFLAIRKLGAERKDLVKQEKWEAALVKILDVQDMADLAVEDLRNQQCWNCAGTVIDILKKKGFDTPIIKKSILRYALQCPSPRAKVFVNEQLARDPEWVADTAEMLELEK